MGTFDPQAGTPDDEHQHGNILNAIMTFPTEYTFNVVGRTHGDEATAQRYAEEVTHIVLQQTGGGGGGGEEGRDGLNELCSVTPRGKSFTRVAVKTMVDSAAIVTSIYDALGAMEATVMRF